MWVENWPNSWPPPDTFFHSLRPCLVSVHVRQLLVGLQIIIHLKNGWGALILHNRLEEALSEVSVIRFNEMGGNEYDFEVDTQVIDLTWCTTAEEVIRFCEKIAMLERPAKNAIPFRRKE